MIDLFDLWETICSEGNIHQAGMIKPERQLAQWANDISTQLFEEKFSVWQKNQKLSDDLTRPFLKSVAVKVATAKKKRMA